MRIYTLNAFCKERKGGNPAAVVLVADSLSPDEMQRIASKIGFSETAFVSKSDVANYRIRFFTPREEIDLCGHATIATFGLMHHLKIIKKGTYKQETNAGILNVEVNDAYVSMQQNAPTFSDIIHPSEIAESLRIPENIIYDKLPIQITSTGLRDILIPISTTGLLNSIKPDFNKIATISEKYGVIGYHLFSLSHKNGAIATCRNFAPNVGINEESATGSSSGALACYLEKYGIVESPCIMTFEQGVAMKQASTITVSLRKKEKQLEVMVGGGINNVEAIDI